MRKNMAEQPSCIPFWVTCELVTEDRDAVDGTARLKVGLNILGRRAIIDL